MKFLVTGGAGFIGSNIVHSLVEDGHEVLVIDNLTTGSLNNLLDVEGEYDFVNLWELFPVELDGIFHLGIPSSSPMYKQDPAIMGKAINDFIGYLTVAKQKSCPMVFASSSSIYNGNPVIWKEDMPIYCMDLYTEARYMMERLASLYHKLYGIRSIGLRLFSVYGQPEKYKEKYANLVSQFRWDMSKGKPPIIFGDGTQSRDFIHVSDVVKAFRLAMKRVPEIECDVINVGTGTSNNLNQLVDMLNEALHKDVRAEYVENPIVNYIPHTLADTRKAEKILGFSYSIGLHQGLKMYDNEA